MQACAANRHGRRPLHLWVWDRKNPLTSTRTPYFCRSWRCPYCSQHESHVLFARFEEAFATTDPKDVVFLVLTLNPQEHLRGKTRLADVYREFSSRGERFLKRVRRWMDRHGITPFGVEWVSTVEAQVPTMAPKNFRRLRSGKGFLPRRSKGELTGAWIRRYRAPEGDEVAEAVSRSTNPEYMAQVRACERKEQELISVSLRRRAEWRSTACLSGPLHGPFFTLGFIKTGHNAVLVGPNGVGKTMLSGATCTGWQRGGGAEPLVERQATPKERGV